MAKILVTGGMGYIGSHTIIELLKNTDFEVVSVDNCMNSSEETIQNIAKITGVSIKNYKVDLCDSASLNHVFESETGLVGVIHFAALKSVPDSVADPLGYYRNNVVGQMNLMEACRKHDVKDFIFSSSCSIYGNVKKLPVDESTPFGIAESPYAYTKQVGEMMLKDFAKVNPDFRIISLRYFNPVGADESGLNGENPINKPTALVPYITRVASGEYPKLTVFGSDYDTRDGSCIRDYIHVSDLADAHIKAIEYLQNADSQKSYDFFNIGSGNGVTVLEAINSFEKATNLKLNYEMGERRAGDVMAIYSDSNKAKKLLGWEAKRGIDSMMTSAWKWQEVIDGK